MGEHEVQEDDLSGEQLRLFMRSLLDDLRALEQLISDGWIESGVRRVGAEQEMFLVGPAWRPSLSAMKGKGTEGERMSALTASSVRQQKSGTPVSKWQLARLDEAGGWKHHYLKVEQFMSTDLYTVHEDEPIDLVASLMDWEKIRHVPVEDNDHRLVGLVSYRSLIHLLAQGAFAKRETPIPVSEVMKRNPITVAPETTTLHAIKLMKEKNVGSLPVVKDDRLIGIVTERDFMDIARELLEEKLIEPAD